MENQKKEYTAPKITKVQLIVKEAVLGTCHASPVQTPRRAQGCNLELACWDGPGTQSVNNSFIIEIDDHGCQLDFVSLLARRLVSIKKHP